ncbi:MAG: DUF4386 domain-containing protein [Christensenellales bacterium]
MTSITKDARRAGLLYLAFIITCMFSGIVRTRLLALEDAAKTAGLLENARWLLKVTVIDDLLSAALFLLAAWALYVLLKPVNPDLALLFLLLNAAGVALQCFSLLNLYAPLLTQRSADIQRAFRPDQLEALDLLFFNLHKSGFTMAQIFYGIWLFPLGLLVYKSGFLPKWLGVLLIADCFGVMITFFQFFLLPGLGMISYPGYAISLIAEFSLSLWLIFKGVKQKGPALAAQEGEAA